MDHAGKGETTPKEDREHPSNRRRVSFKLDPKKNDNHHGEGVDQKPNVHDVANEVLARNGHTQLALQRTNNSGNGKPCDGKSRQSTEMLGGALRTCDGISPSVSVTQHSPSVISRFRPSNLSRALTMSNETRGYIEKEKKRILLRLEHGQRQFHADFTRSSSTSLSSPSHSRDGIQTTGDESSSSVSHRCRRRLTCEQSAKSMLTQRLPLTMMRFVERALDAAHFIRRRRLENGNGRIVHRILIDQHKRIQKLRENNTNNKKNGNHSSGSESKP